MKTISICLLVSFWAYQCFAQTVDNIDNRLEGIEPVMEEILQTWNASGFAVAVVEKNELVYAKAFGYRDYEKKIKADENTLYAIGSCSKAFTTSILGMLREQDKLKFDDSPLEYIPELRFYNDEMNTLVTIKDMMCHRTGLPRHDLSWYLFPSFSKDSLIKRIEFLEPFTGIREQWFYNNFMYMAQGVVGERIIGQTWEQNVKEMIFGPLEMNRSNLSIAELKKDENIAVGYRLQNDSIVKKTDYYQIAGMSPAGSINSSVVEMGNWLITWINGGKFNGEQILPENFVREAMSSQMVVNASLPGTENPDLHMANYGYGWFLSSYKGHYRVMHGGNIDGFSATTCFYPSDSIGIVVLTNQNGSSIPHVVRNTISDRMLDLKYKDWNKDTKKQVVEARQKIKQAIKDKDQMRQEGTRTSHIPVEFAGTYSNPGYGDFELELKNDSLFARFKRLSFWLEHYHYDVFKPYTMDGKKVDTTDVNRFMLNFAINNAGEIASVEIKLEGTLDPIEFKRTPKEIEVDQQQLQRYVGEYDLVGMIAKVYLKEDKKPYLFVPGQPEYTMVPTGKHRFSIKNLDGYKLEFIENETEKITAVNFIQPNGTFKAFKK